MALPFMLANNSVTKNVKLLPLHLRTGDSALLNLPQTSGLCTIYRFYWLRKLFGKGKKAVFQRHKTINFKAGKNVSIYVHVSILTSIVPIETAFSPVVQ